MCFGRVCFSRSLVVVVVMVAAVLAVVVMIFVVATRFMLECLGT